MGIDQDVGPAQEKRNYFILKKKYKYFIINLL